MCHLTEHKMHPVILPLLSTLALSLLIHINLQHLNHLLGTLHAVVFHLSGITQIVPFPQNVVAVIVFLSFSH